METRNTEYLKKYKKKSRNGIRKITIREMHKTEQNEVAKIIF